MWERFPQKGTKLEMKQDFWEAERIREQDPETILVIKLTRARSGWIWRTDWLCQAGTATEVSLGQLDPVLGVMKNLRDSSKE